ncbi:MAG: DUF4290 domain-containing protein [Chlorobi bacterium]|nr:DUF4290 domain-containing protein [Chlorobiota bacterium]
MDYNTTREGLNIKEYGRNVQKLVQYALTIEDREKRTAFAKLIVQIMGTLNPQANNAGDFRHKLWDHLYVISEYQLDVDGPYPPPSKEDIEAKAPKLEYQKNNIRYKVYGSNMEKIIAKAIEFEEGPEKEALIKTIANHLKKSYLNWNRDSVNDDLIFEHLEVLSDGKLKVEDRSMLASTNDILARTRKKKPMKSQSKGSKGKGSKSSNNKKWKKRY